MVFKLLLLMISMQTVLSSIGDIQVISRRISESDIKSISLLVYKQYMITDIHSSLAKSLVREMDGKYGSTWLCHIINDKSEYGLYIDINRIKSFIRVQIKHIKVTLYQLNLINDDVIYYNYHDNHFINVDYFQIE